MVYRDGDEWSEGPCRHCECVHGVIKCYDAECPACPFNTTAVTVQGRFTYQEEMIITEEFLKDLQFTYSFSKMTIQLEIVQQFTLLLYSQE